MTKVFVQMAYTYKDADLQSVLKAYVKKMSVERNGIKTTALTSTPMLKEYQVERNMPPWAARFFNLNSFKYQETAKINQQENTIEISSYQTIANVALKFNMTLFWDPDENSTKATALATVENVPKILTKTVNAFTKKEFQRERDVEAKFIVV
jgi:hypothetical protein